jgi:hypothetical protein
MRRTTLALTALGALVLVISGAGLARADIDYPWCLQGGEQGYPGLCYYQTYEQCRASASGRLVGCGLNPRLGYGQPQKQLPSPQARRSRQTYPN